MPELSPYVIAIGAALVLSQTLKYLILVVRGRSFDHLRQLYSSGNMPSTHSTAVVAFLTLVALRDGTDSGLFGLTLLIAIIVMYDTVMVRRSVGEQGQALQKLIRVMSKDEPLPRAAKGHTPLELAVGAMLGGLIGLVVFFATT